MDRISLPKLSEKDMAGLELPITHPKMGIAINKLKLNRSPSMDGLTSEFYKNFKELLIPHLQELYNWCRTEGTMQKHGRKLRWY